jgi:hypothetical protein
MLQKNYETAELEHAEKIGFVVFPTADESAKVIPTSEEALDFAAAAVAMQFAPSWLLFWSD